MQNKISRRDFLKNSALTTTVLAISCVHMGSREPVILPSIKGIKFPDNGCFVGINGGDVGYYKSRIGAEPKIVAPHVDMFEFYNAPDFRSHIDKFNAIYKQGSIPYFHRPLTLDISQAGDLSKILNNTAFEDKIKRYSEEVCKVGKPFLLTTMREINAGNTSLRPWRVRDSNLSKDVWRYIHGIAQKEGANDYILWTWTVAAHNQMNAHYIYPPNNYYPGDSFVDVIGLSSYSREKFKETLVPLSLLTSQTYSQMTRKHPEKPIIMAEFGRSKRTGQHIWLKNAFSTIKKWPAMKGFVYWDSGTYGDDHSLSIESQELIRGLRSDPYFIFADSKTDVGLDYGRRNFMRLASRFVKF